MSRSSGYPSQDRISPPVGSDEYVALPWLFGSWPARAGMLPWLAGLPATRRFLILHLSDLWNTATAEYGK